MKSFLTALILFSLSAYAEYKYKQAVIPGTKGEKSQTCEQIERQELVLMPTPVGSGSDRVVRAIEEATKSVNDNIRHKKQICFELKLEEENKMRQPASVPVPAAAKEIKKTP